MLKLTYTDNNFYLERLSESLTDWLTVRILLYLRAAESICVKPSVASFSIVADLAHWKDLIALQADNKIQVNLCDAEYMEVSLEGIWVTSEEQTNEGVFVCILSKQAEILLDRLWQICT